MYERLLALDGPDRSWTEEKMMELSRAMPNAFIYGLPYYAVENNSRVERMLVVIRIDEKRLSLMERNIFEHLESSVKR